MASNDPSNGGYDYKFLEDPPDSLKCVICLLVVREPQQHGDCGRLFCNSCITEYKKRQPLGTLFCPYCRETLTTFNDGRSGLEVKSLKLRCQSTECSWQGELRQLKHHLEECDYTLIPCPNECELESELIRKNLHVHLESECPRRKVSCSHCKTEGEHQEITTTHLEKCSKLEIKCPNSGCEDSYPRCETLYHKSICDYEQVSCLYEEFGCDHKDLRKEITKHEEDDKLHLELTKKKVLQLCWRMERLETKLEDWSFTFKLTNFQENKSNDDNFFSDSFYSHFKGYRLQMNIELNGDDGTHISVYANLLEGPNDDSLTWPFTGEITVQLLNQLENKNHYKYSFSLPEDNEQVSGRVVDDKGGRGYGCPEFIPHSDLHCKPDKNCQYLKGDTLFFRISVQVPDHKPWLECTY